ncbi:MAG TPA: DNA polymerase Y family protein, partial [Terriglobales bacterium]|nr:DNA polymerase Y family protein [Terriglobales bacterium]
MTATLLLSGTTAPAQARRYLSLWLPHWSTDRWRLSRRASAREDVTHAPEMPVVAISTDGGRRLICAANESAMRQGFTPGLSLADALARRPDLQHFPANPLDDGHALQRLAVWALRFTPLVMSDNPNGLLLDITGCAHLWQGEEGLRQDMHDRLRRHGYACRIGIADTIGAAWAAARFAEMAPIMPIAGQRKALATLPVDALRIDLATAEALRRLGLRRIGDLYPLPRASIASRFGRLLLERLDQALGDVSEAFAAAFAPPPHRVSQIFAEPIGTAEDLHRSLEMLAARLATQLAEGGLGARRVKFSCYRLDHQVSEIGIGLSLPSAKAPHLIDLLARKIEQLDPGPGVETTMLSAGKVEALRQSQTVLEAGASGDQAIGDDTALAGLIDRLGNRLGAGKVYRLTPVASHLPERAVARAGAVRRGGAPAWPRIVTAAVGSWRPLRLLDHPEVIEDVMAPVPDDPPVQFRWRHVLHRVRASAGPERIVWEWW